MTNQPEFRKYPSITNSYAINPTTFRPFMNDEWYATEKIDGGNFNITLLPSNEKPIVKIYNRNFEITKEMAQYAPLFDLLNQTTIIVRLNHLGLSLAMPQIMAYGEFFGKNLENQKTNYDVDVEGDNSFRLFNIMTLHDDKLTILNHDTINDIFSDYLIPVKARGTLLELLSQPLDEHSIYGGDSEGVVYQPVAQYTIDKNHNTVFRAIKRKNKKFLEIKAVDMSKAKGKDGLVALQLEAYVTQNRVSNVLSHGLATLEPKDTGKLIEAVKRDIFKEFKRDNPNTDVSDDYLHGILKSLSGIIANTIKSLRKETL